MKVKVFNTNECLVKYKNNYYHFIFLYEDTIMDKSKCLNEIGHSFYTQFKNSVILLIYPLISKEYYNVCKSKYNVVLYNSLYGLTLESIINKLVNEGYDSGIIIVPLRHMICCISLCYSKGATD